MKTNSNILKSFGKKMMDGEISEENAKPYLRNDPEYAYYYAQAVMKRRWPEAEDVILSDLPYAIEYAKYVIKGRWPEGEEIIKTDPYWAYYYAKDEER